MSIIKANSNIVEAGGGVLDDGPTPFIQTAIENEYSVTPVGVWSVRRVVKGYTGPCCRLRRASDNKEKDIGFYQNLLDTNQAAAFLQGGDGFLVKFYDQYGGYDLVSSTASEQSLYVEDLQGNGFPGFDSYHDSSSDKFYQSNTPILSECDINMVASLADPNNANGEHQLTFENTDYIIYHRSAGSTIGNFDGNDVASISNYDGSLAYWRSYQTDSELFIKWKNNTDTVSTSNTNSYQKLELGREASNSFSCKLKFHEFWLWSAIQGSGVAATIENDIKRYYGLSY